MPKNIDFKYIVNHCLDTCISNNCITFRDFREKCKEECDDLLIALAGKEHYDHFIELFPLAEHLANLRFGKRNRATLDNLLVCYIEWLYEIDSLTNFADKMINEEWASHYITTPETGPANDVLPIMDDYDRERARSFR